MSIACLLVMAGKAEAPMMLVKAKTAVVEKRMLMVIYWVWIKVRGCCYF